MVKYLYEFNGQNLEEFVSNELAEHLNTINMNIEFFLDWCEEMSDIIYGSPKEYMNKDVHIFREDVNSYLLKCKE